MAILYRSITALVIQITVLSLLTVGSNAATWAQDEPAEPDPAEAAQTLMNATDVGVVAEMINRLSLAKALVGVPALVQRLDDRRVIGLSDPIDVLVADRAGAALRRITGINFEPRPLVFAYGTREQRDATIARWKRWWQANKDVPPQRWLKNHLAPIFDRLAEFDAFDKLGSPEVRRDLSAAAEQIGNSLGTEFAIRAFSSRSFQPQLKAALALAHEWWSGYSGDSLAEWRERTDALDALLHPVVEYRDFLVKANLAGKIALPAAPVQRIQADANILDSLFEQFESDQAQERHQAAVRLAEELGTDFGYLAFAKSDHFKEAANAAVRVATDWWAMHDDHAPADLSQSVAHWETLLEFARRHVEMVNQQMGQ